MSSIRYHLLHSNWSDGYPVRITLTETNLFMSFGRKMYKYQIVEEYNKELYVQSPSDYFKIALVCDYLIIKGKKFTKI